MHPCLPRKCLNKWSKGVEEIKQRMEYDSLKAPRDRPAEQSVVRQANHRPLSDEELGEAKKVLVRDLRFPQIDRRYCDPALHDQKIALFSFIPSKGATPDADGFYGMAKIRGVFPNEEMANERAENLIREHDSYHEIFHTYVGRPFPVTNKSGHEHELKTIDVRNKTVRLISEDILSKKREEEKEVRDMQEREQQLLTESKRAKEDLPEDPYDVYITNQVKRAQLIWTYKETMTKCDQMKDLIRTTNRQIADAETSNPEYRDQYKEKYMKARLDAGISDKQDEESFIKYLGVDLLDNELLLEK